MGKIRITGMNSGLDTDAMVRELVNAYEKQGEKYTKKKTKTEWKQEAWTTLNGKIKTFFSKQADKMKYSSAYSKKTTSISDSSKATIVTGANAVNGTQTLKINALAKAGYLTGGKLDGTDKEGNAVTKDTTLAQLGYDLGETTLKIQKGSGSTATTKSITIDGSMTLGKVASLIGEAGYNASFDETNGRFYISSKDTGAANDFSFVSDSAGGQKIEELLRFKDTYEKNEDGTEKVDESGNKIKIADGPVKIKGEDAQIELNGVTYNSASNNFSINGLTITAKDVSDQTLSLVTDTDYNEIYDNIKNFFKEYNSLMNEMDKLYNAKSSKGYEPLTAEEKEAMTEDEIDKWETRIKDALLKGDSELDTIASTMRRAMLTTITIGEGADARTYSLSSFGIATLGYFEAADNEKNAYHIDGNADDPETSGNEDKLRAMIASNPEDTAAFFQKLANNLYDEMNKIQSRSDSYTSYGNFFSDKKLQNDYVEQTKQVEKWEKYVADQEDKYYKQFTAMESAMSSLNSQQSYISQLFAG